MKRLNETKPILHAVIWIIIYILTNSVGEIISEQTQIKYIPTIILLTILSMVFLIYLYKNNWFQYYGIKKINKANFIQTLFYLPLLAIALIQLIKGINTNLNNLDILYISLIMVTVGLLEELVFRGLLFNGIKAKGNIKKAILITSITFGIGHIVNLANGYTSPEQIIQIIGAILIGFVLAFIIATTKNILPGIIFHVFFNISGSITNENLTLETYILIAIIFICFLYSWYLYKSFNIKLLNINKGNE